LRLIPATASLDSDAPPRKTPPGLDVFVFSLNVL